MEKLRCFAKVAYTSQGFLPIKGNAIEFKNCDLLGINDEDEVSFKDDQYGSFDKIFDDLVISDDIFIIEVNPLKKTAKEILTGIEIPVVFSASRYEFNSNPFRCTKQSRIVSNEFPVHTFFLVDMLENEYNDNFSYPEVDDFDIYDYATCNDKEKIRDVIHDFMVCGSFIHDSLVDKVYKSDLNILLNYNSCKKLRRERAN